MKYCDDINCPHLDGAECDLSFEIEFRVPHSYSDIMHLPHPNWGYVMAKECPYRNHKAKPNNSEIIETQKRKRLELWKQEYTSNKTVEK